MKFLVQIHVGPVQGFIATARRTRDLWYGSWLLSTISKAVARSVLESPGAQLVFPAADAKELAPGSELPVVNLVLAEVEAVDVDAAQAVGLAAREAARQHWRKLCDEAYEAVEDARPGARPPKLLRHELWNAQVDDVLEMFVVAVPLATAGPQAYGDSVDRLRALMASRKGLRDFAPMAGEVPGLPKSSLDGQRSTVMHEDAGRPAPKWREWRRRLGIEPTEHLDLSGLVKRVLGRDRPFVPVGRLALAPWIDDGDAARLLAGPQGTTLREAADALVPDLVGTRLDRTLYPWAAQFPYDGQLMFADRRQVELLRARRDGLPEVERRIEAFGRALAVFRKAAGLSGQPSPYYAMLLADGDRMGQLIDTAANADEHRDASSSLAAFAREVPMLVNDLTHRGACIYSGGDDVLALLRVDKAVACADALRHCFSRHMDPVASRLNERRIRDRLPPVTSPTLSVGIAICHMLEPLGDVRELAKQAEKLAKEGEPGTRPEQQRNALGLLVKPRSGVDVAVRMRWNDTDALARLVQYQSWFASEELPAGLPYELRDSWRWAASIFPQADADEVAHRGALWAGRVRVLLAKKRRPLDDEPLDRRLQTELTAHVLEAPEPTIRALLVSRWLSAQVVED